MNFRRARRLSINILVAASACLLCGSGAEAQSAAKREATRKAARRHLAYLNSLPPVRGLVFHCCSCSVPCPCMFNGDGKDIPGCTIVRVYHITDGGYVGKHVEGLTVVFIPHPDDLRKKAGGLRKEGKPVDGALYYPSGITQRQERDLATLMVEHGTSAVFNNNIHHNAPISFRRLADGYDIQIPGVFHDVVHSVKKADGKPYIADHLKLAEGSRWHIGRSTLHDYQDHDEKAWNWKLPKSNGSWTSFSWGPNIDPSEENEAK